MIRNDACRLLPARAGRAAGVLASALLCALATALAPARAHAQVAPDSPRLISPFGSGGLGIHYVRAETLPGDDVVLVGTWALPFLPDGMRVRGGAGRGAGGNTAIVGGVDLQRPLVRGGAGSPFDLDWQSGLGVSVGDYSLITVPLGLSAGLSLSSGAVWLAPYLTAGVAADLRLGDQAPEKEFEVSPALDVGMDLAFDAERRVVIRAAAALGDRQALSIGVGLGLGRLRR